MKSGDNRPKVPFVDLAAQHAAIRTEATETAARILRGCRLHSGTRRRVLRRRSSPATAAADMESAWIRGRPRSSSRCARMASSR